MSEQAATTASSPVQDDNQSKDTPVSLCDGKNELNVERRYRGKKTFRLAARVLLPQITFISSCWLANPILLSILLVEA